MIFTESPPNFFPLFEVASCFFQCDGKILLLHRLDTDIRQPSVWGLPAGKIEPDETPQDAIIREIKEETGLTISAEHIVSHNTLYVRYPDYDFLYHTFSTKFDTRPDITLNPTEHKAFIWVTPEEALQMKLVTDLDECIRSYFKL